MMLPDDAIIEICQYLDLLTITRSISLVSTQFHSCCYKRRQALDMSQWLPAISDDSVDRNIMFFIPKQPMKREVVRNSLQKTLRALEIVISVVEKCCEEQQVALAMGGEGGGDNENNSLIGSNSTSTKQLVPGCFERVILERCAFVRNMTSPTLFNRFMNLCGGGGHLKVLSFRGCTYVNNTILRLLAQHLCSATIESLDISSNMSITDDGIAAIANSFTNLEKLYLRGIYRLTNNSLVHLSILKDRLKALDLHGIKSSLTLSNIAQFEKLEYLNLQDTDVSFSDFQTIVNQRESTFPNLTYLNVINVASVTDDTLEILFHICESLDVFEVQNNKQITDNGIQYIKGLSVLNIISCSQIGTEGIYSIAQNNPDLQRLEAKEVCDAEDHAFFNLLDACPKLRTLNLAYTNVSSAVLIKALTKTHALKVLNLHECHRVKPWTDQKVHLFP